MISKTRSAPAIAVWSEPERRVSRAHRVFARDGGNLDTIDHLVKVTGFVNSDADFTEPHVVMNGASQLLIDVLGEAGHHARSAVGMATLPLGATVEVELILRIK